MVPITTRVPPLANIEVSENAVQIFTTFSGAEPHVQTLVVDLHMTVDDLKELFMNHSAVRRVLYNIERFDPDRLKFYISGRTLALGMHTQPVEYDGAELLSLYDLGANDTVSGVYHSPGGMAKKGAKKTIGKPEKLQQLHAMHMYHMTKTPSIAVVINPIHAEGYIATTIDGMTETQCLSLKSDYNEIGQLRENSLIETVSPHFVDQIDGWKDEIATLQSRIATAESAVQVAFSKEFYGVCGLVYERFFELVNVRLNTFEENRANAQIQAVQTAAQAQIHAAQAAAQAQVQAAQLEARQFVDAEIARMNAAAPAPMDQDM
jgi:hypothetical protein